MSSRSSEKQLFVTELAKNFIAVLSFVTHSEVSLCCVCAERCGFFFGLNFVCVCVCLIRLILNRTAPKSLFVVAEGGWCLKTRMTSPLSKDMVYLVLQFLKEEKFKESLHM